MANHSEDPPNRGRCVLVVEDELLVRVMAADILMDASYRLFDTRDASGVLAIFEEKNDIEAVFTDIDSRNDRPCFVRPTQWGHFRADPGLAWKIVPISLAKRRGFAEDSRTHAHRHRPSSACEAARA